MINRNWSISIVLVAIAAGLLVIGARWWNQQFETIERTEYHTPEPASDEELTDDRLEDKRPEFDSSIVERRPIGPWMINSSAAVIQLDVPMVRPDVEPELMELHSSYAAAARMAGAKLLPSVNMIDGKAKRFDDGLYAAIEQAFYEGLEGALMSHVALIRRLHDRIGGDRPASSFLAAGLELAGIHVLETDTDAKERFLREFNRDESKSKPIGFYTWSTTLATCYRFLGFFQHEFAADELSAPLAFARILEHDPVLLADYRKMVDFYGKLTNPSVSLSVADLVGRKELTVEQFRRLCKERQVWHETISLFPAASSKETVLFETLFPSGIAPNVNLMRELMRRIRSGEVDLTPGPNSGWYDHQVFALETLLLPERGIERDKLLLTRTYKNRMLEAFQALVTKRRETHIRGAKAAAAQETQHPQSITPRLRIEPCPTYYLRTARAYVFLANFLLASLGQEALTKLHGRTEHGVRGKNLAVELAEMRDLFYGLHLISAEDIGMKSGLSADEPVNIEACYQRAVDWLAQILDDPDLAVDTRVAVPIYVDPNRPATRLWLTLGVRLTKLDAHYVRPPHLKRANAEGDWNLVDSWRLLPVHMLIPVDEFGEVELPARHVLTREEFRAICSRETKKEAILKNLQMEIGDR